MKSEKWRIFLLFGLVAGLAILLNGNICAGAVCEKETSQFSCAFAEQISSFSTEREKMNMFMSAMGNAERNACGHGGLKYVYYTYYQSVSSYEHAKMCITYEYCSICDSTRYISERNMGNEQHSFGPETYSGSNHDAANPKSHYSIYSKTCSICNATVTRREPTACTQYGCVNVQSTKPEKI